MMTTCEQCGAQTPSEAVYCPKCGHRLGTGASTAEKPSGSAADNPADSAEPTTAQRVQEAIGKPRDYDPEEQLWSGTYSPKAMIGSWILAAIVSLALIALTAIFFAPMPVAWIVVAVILVVYWIGLTLLLAYRRFSVHYQLTSQRFIHQEGLLSRKTDRIEVIDIDDVTFQQGLVERMVGVGTINIISSDRSHPKLSLYGIEDVQRIAGLIDDVRRAKRRRRGIHIEAV